MSRKIESRIIGDRVFVFLGEILEFVSSPPSLLNKNPVSPLDLPIRPVFGSSAPSLMALILMSNDKQRYNILTAHIDRLIL